jgi:hypothetical protein
MVWVCCCTVPAASLEFRGSCWINPGGTLLISLASIFGQTCELCSWPSFPADFCSESVPLAYPSSSNFSFFISQPSSPLLSPSYCLLEFLPLSFSHNHPRPLLPFLSPRNLRSSFPSLPHLLLSFPPPLSSLPSFSQPLSKFTFHFSPSLTLPCSLLPLL